LGTIISYFKIEDTLVLKILVELQLFWIMFEFEGYVIPKYITYRKTLKIGSVLNDLNNCKQ